MKLYRLMPLLALLVAADVTSQVTPGKVLAGATLCPQTPIPGQRMSCKNLTVGSDVQIEGVTTSMWAWVNAGGERGFVERSRLQLPGDPVASLPVGPVQAGGVCGDSLYVALKRMPLNGLSEREYQYFLERDRACTEFQRAAMQTEPQREAMVEAKKASKAMNNWLVGSAVLSLLSGFFIYSQYR